MSRAVPILLSLLVAGVLVAPVAAANPRVPPLPGRISTLMVDDEGRPRAVTGRAFAARLPGERAVLTERDVALYPAVTRDVITGLADDSLRLQQWALDVLEAEAVWDRTAGGGVTVAVVDSGIHGSHADLSGRVAGGWSAVGGSYDVDSLGHGTHVAGTIAAVAGNGLGVAGLAPDVSLLSVRVIGDTGSAWASDVANGVVWAADQGAAVINLSLASSQRSYALDAAVSYATARGVIVVAAAGNDGDGDNRRMWPASHPDVIAVAAVDTRDQAAAFSSSGDWVDLAAPGVAIASTLPDGRYGTASGTSMAAPHVAAAVALLRAADPTADADALRAALENRSVDLGAAGWDPTYGHGRLDVLAALPAEIVPLGDLRLPASPPVRPGMARWHFFTAPAVAG